MLVPRPRPPSTWDRNGFRALVQELPQASRSNIEDFRHRAIGKLRTLKLGGLTHKLQVFKHIMQLLAHTSHLN